MSGVNTSSNNYAPFEIDTASREGGKGGAEKPKNNVAFIVMAVFCGLIILAVIGLLIWNAVSPTTKVIDVNLPNYSPVALKAAANSRMLQQKKPLQRQLQHNSYPSNRAPNNRMMMPLRAPPNAYIYPPTQYQEPIYDAPAPMPQSQLMQPPNMPVQDIYLAGVPSSYTIIGDSQMDIMTTENQGTSVDAFSDGNYLMDPGMMTPSSATDIKGLQTFMPYMGGGIGENDNLNNGDIGGPVDPNTGLPLFTTGKLIRSQLLGGHGAGSFLRQVQDPLSGYKKSVGKNMCGVQQARRDLEVRRKQLNAARLEHPDADPILFNMSDFAYN